MSGDGRGRPRDPILEELRWLYPGVSDRTLFRWKVRLLENAEGLDGATDEERIAWVRERLLPKAGAGASAA